MNISNSSYAMVVRHPFASDDVVHWLGFLEPFRPAVWYTLGIIGLIFPICLYFILKIAKQMMIKDSELEDPGDIFLDVMRTICQQGNI